MFGAEAWGAPVASAAAYSLKHVAVALIGILGIVATGLTAWLVFGSFRWALVAAAFLGSLPLWVGHSMFNIKDIPFATGYALVTAGLVTLFARKLSSSQRIIISSGSLFLGLLIGIGTRPGGSSLFFLSALVAVFLWFLVKDSRLTVKARLAAALGVVGLFTFGTLLMLFFTELGQNLLAGVLRSLDFPWEGFNLYAGERVTSRPGVVGLGQVFLAYMPLMMIALVIAGLVFGAVALTRRCAKRSEGSMLEPAFVVILTQAFGVFIVVALFDSVVYDGGRQLIFIFPALALIAVFGLFGLMKALPFITPSGRSGRRWVVGIIGVWLTIITFEQVRFFPYNYSYYNVIAQGPQLNGQWQTDYWYASSREAAQFVAPSDPAMCGSGGSYNYNLGELPDVCRTLAPYVGEGAEATESILEDREFWVIRNERILLEFGPITSDNCRLHRDITRPLRGEDVVMSRAYICLDR